MGEVGDGGLAALPPTPRPPRDQGRAQTGTDLGHPAAGGYSTRVDQAGYLAPDDVPNCREMLAPSGLVDVDLPRRLVAERAQREVTLEPDRFGDFGHSLSVGDRRELAPSESL